MKRSRGFTMIEVLVSIALLAGITTIMWVTINTMFETRDRVTERYKRYQVMRVAMDRMTREIASAYVASPAHGAERRRSPVQGGSQGGDDKEANETKFQRKEPVQFGMKGREDELNFTSLAHVRTTSGEKSSYHAEIGYEIRRTRQNGDLVKSLVRREDPTVDDDITEGGKVYTLIPRVEDVEFRYWDPGEVNLGSRERLQGGDWQREWDTEDQGYRDRLPMRVQLEITLPPDGPRGSEQVFRTQAEVKTHVELDL